MTESPTDDETPIAIADADGNLISKKSRKPLPRLHITEIQVDAVSPALKAYRQDVIPARNALAVRAYTITDLNRKKARRCGDALLLQDGPLSKRNSVVIRIGDFQNYYQRAISVEWLLTALGYSVTIQEIDK